MGMLVTGCGSQYGSIDDLREVVGCVEDFGQPDHDGGSESIGCTGEDGVESFYLSVFDSTDDRDDELNYLRGLPKDGTAGKWVVYGEDWSIICFTETVCEALERDTEGTLERLK